MTTEEKNQEKNPKNSEDHFLDAENHFLDADYLTPNAAAEFLHLSIAVLARWRLDGAGPLFFQPNGPGSKVWYRRRDLIRWVEGGARGGRETVGQAGE